MALVYAFQPRRSDPPHFVAETEDELKQKLGELIPGEQCDHCGNSCYRVDLVGHGSPKPIFGFSAICTTDPDQPASTEDQPQPTGCGIGYPIHLKDEDEVVF